MDIYIFTYIHTYIYIYTHMYIYVYIHTHPHINLGIHVCINVVAPRILEFLEAMCFHSARNVVIFILK